MWRRIATKTSNTETHPVILPRLSVFHDNQWRRLSWHFVLFRKITDIYGGFEILSMPIAQCKGPLL